MLVVTSSSCPSIQYALEKEQIGVCPRRRNSLRQQTSQGSPEKEDRVLERFLFFNPQIAELKTSCSSHILLTL